VKFPRKRKDGIGKTYTWGKGVLSRERGISCGGNGLPNMLISQRENNLDSLGGAERESGRVYQVLYTRGGGEGVYKGIGKNIE